MAIKAVVYIADWLPETDETYRLGLDIAADGHVVSDVPTDTYFSSTTAATTVNAAVRGFVEGYIQSEWDIEFNPLLDSVKIVNPVSLL